MKRIALVVCLALLCGTVQAVEVAMITKAMDSEWWRSVRAGAEKFASETPELRLAVHHPEREVDIDRQVEIIREQTANRVGALILAPCGIQELMPVLEEVTLAGIPFVIFDGDMDIDSPCKKAYVGPENYEGGKLAGKYALELLPHGGEIAIITGVMDHGSHISRVAGFIDRVQTNKEIHAVIQQQANSERDLSRRLTRGILDGNPRVKLIFATNDEMALGAAEAVREAGCKTAIIGFDGTEEAKEAIKSGLMHGSIDSKPFLLGYEAARAGYLAATGAELPEIIPIDYRVITPATVDDSALGR